MHGSLKILWCYNLPTIIEWTITIFFVKWNSGEDKYLIHQSNKTTSRIVNCDRWQLWERVNCTNRTVSSSRRSKISLLFVFTFFTVLWNPCSCTWCLSSCYGLLHSFLWCLSSSYAFFPLVTRVWWLSSCILSSLPRIQTSDEWGRARASRFHGESQINRITRITRIARCSTTFLYLLWSNTNCIQTFWINKRTIVT